MIKSFASLIYGKSFTASFLGKHIASLICGNLFCIKAMVEMSQC